jgi:uncharacterized membrane protein
VERIELLPLIARWAHIFAAVAAVGGIFFLRVVLLPSMSATLADEGGERLRDAVLRRWAKVVHTCIALFLISGLYNYLVIMVPAHEGQSAYHMAFGIKFLLALVIFFLAIALTSSRTWAAPFRTRSVQMQGLVLILMVVVILISGYMRALPPADELASESPPAESVVVE